MSLDGRSAYDCMSRAAFLTKLHEVAPELLPFVHLFYGRPSTYSWWDDQGRCRQIQQGEGCEQGDPLAPALFALGQHDALHRAATTLRPDESLLAFLDDLYITTTPPRARTSLDTTVEAVADHCGIGSNLGKTRVMGAREGPPPPGIAELGDEVWRGDLRSDQRGIVVLGTPVGHPDFIIFHPSLGNPPLRGRGAATPPAAKAAGPAMLMAAPAALCLPSRQPRPSHGAAAGDPRLRPRP